MQRATIAAILATLMMLGNSPPELLAQEKPDNKLSIEVKLVRIDALVLDKGRPALGLTKDDFEVREDGVLQEIKYLSDDPAPLSLVILIDQSGSLEKFFEGVKKTAKSALDSLPPGDEVAIVGFDNNITISTAFTTDREKTAATISKMPNTLLGTNIVAALNHGIEKLKQVHPSRRRVLVLISDNEIESTSLANVKINEKVLYREAMVNELAVYNIKVGHKDIYHSGTQKRSPGEILVRTLVEKTGGGLIDAREKNPAKALSTMVEHLKYTYSIFYIPRDLENAGMRKVKVELTNNPKSLFVFKKYKVIARKEYYFEPKK